MLFSLEKAYFWFNEAIVMFILAIYIAKRAGLFTPAKKDINNKNSCI
jgi:hypothetical protein